LKIFVNEVRETRETNTNRIKPMTGVTMSHIEI
jgi:hypothetical protein